MTNADRSAPELTLLTSPGWKDYELLDSGGGLKLERYGPYTFVRPEHQAIWSPVLSKEKWDSADAVFQVSGGESGGQWLFRKTIQPRWEMQYKGLKFHAHARASRHMGVFPEQANQWDWMADRIKNAQRPVRVLNIFGYTGLATLAVSRAGAHVTHVDASKNAITQARQNQSLSGLSERPIRWLVDDALKFVRREVRRGSSYDGLVLDPPKFGRGPKGQVWEFFDSMPTLLQDCRLLLSDRPIFVALTAYAIRASALSLYYSLDEMLQGFNGSLTAGELALVQKSNQRLLSTSIFARWEIDE